MADAKISSFASHGTPVAADYVASVLASGPTSKKLLMSDLIKYAGQWFTPGGRLTLESGVPISTTDQTAKTNIYYTPCIHNIINLWDGSNWVPTEFTEKTLALGTITSAKPYDVFGYLSAGALVLELLAWTNDTTRATAVTLQDGRYCKSGDKTRLLLGSFYTTSTTTTEDSEGGTTTQEGGKRFLSNVYNQVKRAVKVIDTADNWSYKTNTIRKANGATGVLNAVEVIQSVPGHAIFAEVKGVVFLISNSAVAAKVGIGVNSTSAFTGLRQGAYNFSASGVYSALACRYTGQLPVGYNYLAWLEKGADGSTCIFLGDNAADGQQTGLEAEVWT